MKEVEYFEEKLTESAEINVDIDEVYKQRIKNLSNIFKHAFGQPTKEFNKILDYMFFVNGVPEPESKGKLEKILVDFITAVRYFTYLGIDEDKINRQLSNFGITITKTDWSPVGGEKENKKKYSKAWSELFPNDDPKEVNDDLLKFLLNEALDAKSEILALSNEVKAIGENVEMKCEVSKSAFNKGVSLKTLSLKGKDIDDKVTKIEKQADEVSQIIEKL